MPLIRDKMAHRGILKWRLRMTQEQLDIITEGLKLVMVLCLFNLIALIAILVR